MPNALSQLQQVYVEDRAAWRRWLVSNHASSPGIWLVFDKKASRADRLAYADAVEEALCYGWIDSLVRRIDDARYVQLFTPRKPTSVWSRLNKERVARLIEQGLMADAGLAAIERAKENGKWTTLDTVESLEMPEDLAAALRRTKGAEAGFASFSRSNRKHYLYWVNQAVRPETRAKRVAEVAARSAAKIRNRFIESDGAAKSTAAPARQQASKGASPVGAKRAATAKKSATSGGGSQATRAAGGTPAAKLPVKRTAKRPAKRTAKGPAGAKPRGR